MLGSGEVALSLNGSGHDGSEILQEPNFSLSRTDTHPSEMFDVVKFDSLLQSLLALVSAANY